MISIAVIELSYLQFVKEHALNIAFIGFTQFFVCAALYWVLLANWCVQSVKNLMLCFFRGVIIIVLLAYFLDFQLVSSVRYLINSGPSFRSFS